MSSAQWCLCPLLIECLENVIVSLTQFVPLKGVVVEEKPDRVLVGTTIRASYSRCLPGAQVYLDELCLFMEMISFSPMKCHLHPSVVCVISEFGKAHGKQPGKGFEILPSQSLV